MDLLCTHCGAVVLAHRDEPPTGEQIAAAIAAHEPTCPRVPAQRALRPVPQRASQ
jgi:hypothetical protein